MANRRKRARAMRGSAGMSALAHLRAARDLSLAVTLVYLLLSGLVGFSHRPIATDQPQQTVTLPGGVPTILCLGNGSDDRNTSHVTVALCDACLLTAAPGLVARSAALAEPFPASILLPRLAAAVAPNGRLISAAKARGPPCEFVPI